MLIIMGKLEKRMLLSTLSSAGRFESPVRRDPLDLDFGLALPAASAVAAAAAAAVDFDADREEECFGTPLALDTDVLRGVVLDAGGPGFFRGGAISETVTMEWQSKRNQQDGINKNEGVNLQ
jgi:hypothetical protein